VALGHRAPETRNSSGPGPRGQDAGFAVVPRQRHCSKFWATALPSCREQIANSTAIPVHSPAGGLQILGINVDDPGAAQTVRSFAAQQGISIPQSSCTQEWPASYNIFILPVRRRPDLPIPVSLLLDKAGIIVRCYQGRAFRKAGTRPEIGPGTQARGRYGDHFLWAECSPGCFKQERLHLRRGGGSAMFQRGYLEQANGVLPAGYRRHRHRKDPEAITIWGTLYLRRKPFPRRAAVPRADGISSVALSGSVEQKIGMVARTGRSDGRGVRTQTVSAS